MATGRAIVLSGGGAKGSYQVGVLDQLVRQYGIDFDIFVGTSTGAIQALGGAMGKLDELVDFWENRISNSDNIFNRVIPDGPYHSLRDVIDEIGASFKAFSAVKYQSVYDASPLRQLLHEFADQDALSANGKKLLIGVVSLQSGEFRAVDETAHGIADWVYASCAEPGLFQPMEQHAQTPHADSNGKAGKRARVQWIDGGIREVTPVMAALQQRPERVLVVRASPKTRPETKIKSFGTLPEIVMRAITIQHAEVSNNDYDFGPMYQSLWEARRDAAIKGLDDGLDPVQIDALLAPFDKVLHDHHVAPVMTIEPEVHHCKDHEFEPDKIRHAIKAGRDYVDQNIDAIRSFLIP
jgi:NTE family protein